MPRNLISLIRQVNFYDDDPSMRLSDQLWATRIYAGLLTISIVILLFFTGLKEQTHIVTVLSPSPSTFDRLVETYPSTLVCPCSKISIPYRSFLSFAPHYHQVCSSGFVSSEWISSLFMMHSTDDYYPLDFRLVASTYFQALAYLCRISNRTVFDTLEQFLSTGVVSNQVLSRASLDSHVTAMIEQVQKNTIATVAVIDQFVSLSIDQNRFMSALRTNAYMSMDPNSKVSSVFACVYPTDFNESTFASKPPDSPSELCSCSQMSRCSMPSGIFESSGRIERGAVFWPYPPPLFFVPGIKIGCLPMDALYRSTLECFFSAECLSTLLRLTGALQTISPLDDSAALSHFRPNASIGAVFGELFIESWQQMSNYSLYFQTCEPTLCTYSYSRKLRVIYMVATLFGIIGGLSVALRLLSPYLLQAIYKVTRSMLGLRRTAIQRFPSVEDASLPAGFRNRLLRTYQKLCRKLVTLNLFKTTMVDTHNGVHATRMFLVLSTGSFLVLTIYSAATLHTRSATIYEPSFADFEGLHQQYLSTLSCPCRHVSVNYSSIMTIRPRYHQVCTSAFVDLQRWFLYWDMYRITAPDLTRLPFRWNDFREIGRSLFYLLQTFCKATSEMVANEINNFDSTQFVSDQPLTREEFRIKTSAVLNSFSSKVNTTSSLIKASQAKSTVFDRSLPHSARCTNS